MFTRTHFIAPCLLTPLSFDQDLGSANSLDLNLVYYKISGVVQQPVYQSQKHKVDKLRQRLVNFWHGDDHSITDNTCIIQLMSDIYTVMHTGTLKQLMRHY